MTEPHELTALQQAQAVRRGELSPTELVEHALQRVAELDPVLGAFVTVTAERAREDAIDAEKQLAHASEPAELPPLLGVPTAIKDLAATAGVPTGFGAVAYAGFVPELDDDSVRLLRAAGTISLGKTATPEFGLPPYTEPVGRPPAVTPWDAGRLAGGSSDAAAMLDALAVPIPGEPYPAAAPPAKDSFLARAQRAQPGRLRVGRYATPVLSEVTVEPECIAGYQRASELMAELGHEVVEFDVGVGEHYLAAFETVWAVLAHSHPVWPDAEPLLTPLTRWWRARGAAASGPEFLAAMQRSVGVARQVAARHAEVDVVLTPTLAQLPRPVGWFTAGGNPAEDYERQKRFAPFTALYNVTGHPALNVPLYWTDGADGPVLPVGVQLVGPRGGDALLLELGAQLEAAAPWCDRRPPTG